MFYTAAKESKDDKKKTKVDKKVLNENSNIINISTLLDILSGVSR